MKPSAYTGTPAEILAQLAKEHGTSLAALSRMLRRGPRYLDGFVRDDTPSELLPAECKLLGAFFRVDAWLFERH